MKGLSILGAAALLLGAIGAQAAGPPTTFKCSAAQIKCANGKATAFLGCHNKAETKTLPVDPECITKAEQKFTLPAKGCMDKAEKDLVKSPCFRSGASFITTLENKVDAFVIDVVTELDPGYPAPVLSKCSAGKKKCVANKVKALLGCYNKAAGKGLPLDQACIQKAKDKFDGGADPTKGCFAKLEAKVPSDCLTTGDSGALEAKADAFALDVANEATPPAVLDFSTTAGGGTCGDGRDVSNAVVVTLHCGGLNIGKGDSTLSEGNTPDGSTNRFSLGCVGTTCTILPNSTAPAPNSADPDCSAAGCNFGAPLEILNLALPALTSCVLNSYKVSASGGLDLSTGATSTISHLNSDTFTTGNTAEPCPRCFSGGVHVVGSPASPATGTCDRGATPGAACTSSNSVGLTRDCKPGGVDGTHPCTTGGGLCTDGSTHVGILDVDLSPLGTGTSSMSNAGGIFCPDQPTPGCFKQPTCTKITENGAPGGPVVAGVPGAATLASVFCIPTSGSGLVDIAAGLPGPGATALVGTFTAHAF